ncbi:hypothetical protein OO013_00135 [Mangrovivirga sp. M17]|uniref:DUF4369 domain-containing protein n=1 Tax=Mangrovivirga halotolerans TaxID=2993936 RepID=A0ABT3RKZ7_9BACT|nr:hypothetical protein [Mangrovivirga halotolerans]MCX2742246.1 hypothetical protein [Mangrovivirga halotolerans]
MRNILKLSEIKWDIRFLKTIRLAVIIFFGFLFINDNLLAQQFPSETFHPGTAILEGDKRISGKLKYDLENNIIQVINNGVIQTFTSQKVVFFIIEDQVLGITRKFYSLPYERNNYQSMMFFELLVEGDLTLLGREYIDTRTTTNNNSFYYRSYWVESYVLRTNFYFLRKGGEINFFEPKKRELLDIMDDKSDQIKQYIKKRRFDIDRPDDLMEITKYYNNLNE